MTDSDLHGRSAAHSEEMHGLGPKTKSCVLHSRPLWRRRFQIVNTQCAIADATDNDERQINHNFDYDDGAYESIQRNFRSLIEPGRIEDQWGV